MKKIKKKKISRSKQTALYYARKKNRARWLIDNPPV